MSHFLVIAITSAETIVNEALKITNILDKGEADIVHIRKPSWSMEQTANLIEKIPAGFHPRLKIHDHFTLMDIFNLHGVHLNNRNPQANGYDKNLSKSCHSLEELTDWNRYEYMTLSPIFDSISKVGYRSAFNVKDIASSIKGKNVIALGGVNPDKFPLLRETGFKGAAMSGYFWN
ncbi:MAG: thiamine phosphate synthase [Muribaculaceae bacterium]|nr:thiamine phosphate synthase [Muribaculaceae bacterium]